MEPRRGRCQEWRQDLQLWNLHAPARLEEGSTSVSYKLDKKFSTFQTGVSLDERSRFKEFKDFKGKDFKDFKKEPKGPRCQFTVYGDGNVLWTSGRIGSPDESDQCKDISINGVDVLKLEVTPFGPPMGMHAIWLDPSVNK